MEIECAVQNYAWGVKGKQSSVAQLAEASRSDFSIEESKPYAELWMGTHPNGPSVIKGSGKLLSAYVDENPDTLGKDVTSKFGTQLPFLFKVLSVNQALSIQAHPNKSHAEELHKSRPDVYKDPNHKPEMTVALTPFLALCGFRPATEIISFFAAVPELVTVIGQESADSFKANPTAETLKVCFGGLMTAAKDVIASALCNLSNRIKTLDASDKEAIMGGLFETLLSQYPADGGCFAIYLLNIVKLKPGDAMFLGPNIIHAYLQGDCIECMACSDNVVRAGLTPKYQDVSTLLSMLEYQMSDANSRLFEAETIDENCRLFNPPVPDFAVESIKVGGGNNYTLRILESCSILLVVGGRASLSCNPSSFTKGVSCPSTVARGSVLFLPANAALSIEAEEDVTLFRALCA